MFAVLMACFALAIAALALVGLALLTSRAAALTKGLDYRIDRLAEAVKQTTPTAIKAELDDLRGALDVIRSSNRKELGGLWARIGGKPNSAEPVTYDVVPAANDSSFAAMLDLQNRPPAGPAS